MKTLDEIINQYLPDGGYGGLNHFNENKVKRMIEQANSIIKFEKGLFTIKDIIDFAKWRGLNVIEEDVKQWINEK